MNGPQSQSPPLLVSLREFFLGCLYVRGLLIFEKYMDAFVKYIMRRKFPLSASEKDAQHKFKLFEEEQLHKKKNLSQLLQDAKKQLDDAQNDKNSTLNSSPSFKEKVKAVTAAKSKLKSLQNFPQQFEKLRKQRRQNYVQPRYVRECQSVVAPSMASVTTVDRQWDMYSHAEIITGHLREIFAPAIQCGPFEFRAKELLDKLRLASQGRTLRAHPEQYERPHETEVVDFLGTMHKVLKLCKCDDGADEIWTVLDEAQALMEKAVAVTSSAPKYAKVSLSLVDLQRHMLYVGICEFTERLQRLVGKFRFKESSVSIPGAESGAGWPTAWQRRVKDAKTLFKTIALARSALFHSDHEKWKRLDVMSALRTMGEVLHWLHPGPLANSTVDPPKTKRGSCPHDWTHHLALKPYQKQSPSHDVDVLVSLQLSDGSMRIPITPERNFVGREREVEELEKALAPNGARVLVHGIAGIGKDTLVTEVLRGNFVKQLKDVHIMAWLQGSSDTAFRRQLVHHFLTHRRRVLRGHEDDQKACIKAIHHWLKTNDDWLFFVEDATTECRALFECIPLHEARGRVVVTSKERLGSAPDMTGHRSGACLHQILGK